MSKYIITWDAGFGDSYEVIDVATFDEALVWAEHNWQEEAAMNAAYDAIPYTEDLAEEMGL